jgi:hypothetical protein
MRIIERLAEKYNPSLSGAIGLLGSMVILGTLAAVPVAAAIGAGVATVFTGAAALTGALWGGGLAAGAGAALVGRIAVPQAVYAACYKHQLKKHVAAGGSTSGMKWVPGIENMRKASAASGISSVFGKGKTPRAGQDQPRDNDGKPPRRPDAPPKP